jgi:gamma-hexachlorocyclohexane dehydrochlorinase
MSPNGEELLARIDELESTNRLRELVADYCHGLDKRDEERFMRVWHKDAVWEMGSELGDFWGSAQIQQALVNLVWLDYPVTTHLAANHVVEFQDADRATGLCDLSCEATLACGDHLQTLATCTDIYERRNGRWAIVRRSVDVHHSTVVPPRLRATGEYE